MQRASNGWHTSGAVLLALAAVACSSENEPSAATGGAAGSATTSAGGSGGDVGVFGPSADCTFEIATTGAVAASYAPDPLGCSTFGEDLYAIFVREDELQAGVRVAGFKEGETGKQLSAAFELGKLDLGGWRTGETGCTVEITDQTLLGPAPPLFEKTSGRQYRITGHGDCAEPAKDQSGAGPDLVVGPFSFRARQSFYD